MAYTVPWDEGSPIGASTPANTIDTELQNLKISMRERLEDLINDWANDLVDPKTFNLDAFPPQPKVELHRVAPAQTIPNDTETAIIWNSEIEDVGDMWDSGDPTKIVIPSNGLYLVAAMAFFEPNANGSRYLKLSQSRYSWPIFVDSSPGLLTYSELYLAAHPGNFQTSDEIVIKVYQDSGGGLDLRSGQYTHAFVVKLF